MGEHTLKPYPFKRNCYTPILPLVYSDALSYIETLAQFAFKLNEVIDSLNNIEDETLEKAKEYTDGEILKQISLINDAVEKMTILSNTIRLEMNALSNTVDSRVALVESNFDKLTKKTEADYKAATNYTNLAIQANNEYLIDNMQKELANVKVLNYFTGEYITVQAMFDYLSRFHLSNAISVATLIERSKTVQQLVDYNMTMTDLATRGASIITN